MTKIISVEKTVHKKKPRLKLLFDGDNAVINEVQRIKDCRWSASLGCWHIPYYDNHLSFLNRKFNGKIRFLPTQEPADKQTSPSQKAEPSRKVQVPQAFVEQMKIRRFSRNTIKAYSSTFGRFLDFYSEQQPEQIEPEQVRKYLLHLVENTNVSASLQNQTINAIKFYFESVLNRPLEPFVIQRPKKEKKLPTVLSEEEVARILKQIRNLKHRCVIYLIYSAGLRRSEVLKLGRLRRQTFP